VRHEYYFANNAETKPLDEFRAVIAEPLDEDCRNPSSVDGSGDRARRGAHEARGRAANVFVAWQRGIVLAAGRTEANLQLLSVLGWTSAHRCRAVSTNVEQLPYPKRCPRRPSLWTLALNRPELIAFT
jgi:cysteine sulfinate desulfinase/cysteine desulfurase-like protein